MQAFQAAGKTIPVPRDPRRFLIDFLPVVRRTLQRDGFTLDHITYFSNALRPWIEARDRPNPLLIRCDPRDLSRIFVFDDASDVYLEVPYRVLSRPAITLWEHKLARKRLRAQRRGNVDEVSLFTAIDELRTIERQALSLTRSARRNRTRRQAQHDAVAPVERTTPHAPAAPAATGPVRPFDDIEQW
jgi:putative transposase